MTCNMIQRLAFICALTSSLAIALTSPSTAHAEVDLSEFNHIDAQHIVPDEPLKEAVTYLKNHNEQFKNQKFMAVVDYSQPATSKRMYIINLKSGRVERHLVAAGKGSDPRGNGRATVFSNRSETHASSLGFFKTGEVYFGKHGLSLRLDGLSPTNRNARTRAIVIHGAPNYVNEKTDRAGRSWGCLAMDPQVVSRVVQMLKGGALIYSWNPILEDE